MYAVDSNLLLHDIVLLASQGLDVLPRVFFTIRLELTSPLVQTIDRVVTRSFFSTFVRVTFVYVCLITNGRHASVR